MPVSVVNIKSAWASKINWTQFLSSLFSLLAAFGLDIPAEQKLIIVVAIDTISSTATWIFKTWYTSTITPSSIKS